MRKLLSIALSAVILCLGLGAPAGAQTATEYGVITSQAPHPKKSLSPQMKAQRSHKKQRVKR